jgi:hypothetical protein
MAHLRIHRYAVEPADVEELIARRTKLITTMRAAGLGLAETRLIRLDDGTFVDYWRWDDAEQMQAAGAGIAAGKFPEARAAMSLTRDKTDEDGELVDER